MHTQICLACESDVSTQESDLGVTPKGSPKTSVQHAMKVKKENKMLRIVRTGTDSKTENMRMLFSQTLCQQYQEDGVQFCLVHLRRIEEN